MRREYGFTDSLIFVRGRIIVRGRMKRVLFLVDRNILVDQTMTNNFKPFAGAMTKIGHCKTDKSFEIHMALYQAVSGTEEEKNIYKNFSAGVNKTAPRASSVREVIRMPSRDPRRYK